MRPAGFTIWLTGLPSSGKSTLALHLQEIFLTLGTPVTILDGDEVRQRLTNGLGFTKADRDQNISRISYVARLLTNVGSVAITAAISPYRSMRDRARTEIGNFIEVHVNCPLEVCIRRDVKGLYAKAIKGQIDAFTGISDPYEPPVDPELVVNTDRETIQESAQKVMAKLIELGYLSADALRNISAHSAYRNTMSGSRPPLSPTGVQ
jgi:adenylyl-sulfate kinase